MRGARSVPFPHITRSGLPTRFPFLPPPFIERLNVLCASSLSAASMNDNTLGMARDRPPDSISLSRGCRDYYYYPLQKSPLSTQVSIPEREFAFFGGNVSQNTGLRQERRRSGEVPQAASALSGGGSIDFDCFNCHVDVRTCGKAN